MDHCLKGESHLPDQWAFSFVIQLLHKIWTHPHVPPASLSLSPTSEFYYILDSCKNLHCATLFPLANSQQWQSFPVDISPEVICDIFIIQLQNSRISRRNGDSSGLFLCIPRRCLDTSHWSSWQFELKMLLYPAEKQHCTKFRPCLGLNATWIWFWKPKVLYRKELSL